MKISVFCRIVAAITAILTAFPAQLTADVLVDIDVTESEVGKLPSITNDGTLGGTFEAEVDSPSITEVDGVKAITLDGTNDWYIGPASTPLAGNVDRSIEAWVNNPTISREETVVAWGRRGGGAGTNWSMNYGNNNAWGVLGAWGNSGDMPFFPVGGAPEAGQWHHLALIYDSGSNTRSIYVDGELTNSENDGPALNTHAVDNTGAPLPIVIGNQNESNGTRIDTLSGSLSIAKLKIHDTALSAKDVLGSYDSDLATFQKAVELVHQWTFDEEGGAGTTLVDSVGSADGTIVDVGANDGVVVDGKVTLTGGGKADSDYVRLPAGLLSSLASATLETWSTQHSTRNWARVFSVGSSASNVMHMSFTRGGNINQNELRWNAQANITLQDFGGAPTNPIDERVHWVVTIDDVGGSNGKTKLTVYKDGAEVKTGDTTNDLSGLNDADFFLGRSQWGDNAANASWDEFRIYDGVLTPSQIEASGEAGPSTSAPLNEAPVIVSQAFTLSETASDSFEIGTLVATDSNKDTLSYTITSNTNADSDDNDAFSISGSKLILNDSGDIDYESAASLQVTVRVSDGELTADATITVNLTDDRTEDADGDGLTEAQEEDTYGTSDTNLNSDGDGYTDAVEVAAGKDPADATDFPNEAPVIVSQAFTLSETASDSFEIGTLVATDSNKDTLSYTITSNTNADSDDEDAFSISDSKLILNDSGDIDYESAASLQVTVRVSDGESTADATITVNLTDDRTEDADGDGLTEAQEEDTYGTSDTNLNSDGDGYTDAVEVAAGKDPADATDFPNEAPVIVSQAFTLSETASDSFEIGTLVATDSNKDTLSYTITSNTNADSDDNDAFSISGSKLILNDSGDIDYESAASLQVTVRVSDGVLTADATITVNLTDDRTEDADGDGLTEAQEEDTYGTSDTNLNSDGDGYSDEVEVAAGKDPADAADFPNEAPVIADQSFTVSETISNSSEIGTLVATDSNKDTLSYTITSNTNADSDDEDAFSISDSKLILNDSGDIDYESAASLQITVQVSDGVLTDIAKITVNLTDDRTEDADGDGLTEAQEEDVYKTSDTNLNSDGDGYSDAEEVAAGYDPADPKVPSAVQLNDLTWTTVDGKVTITDCDEAATGELVIPNAIEGNPVTGIGDYAFWKCSNLTSVTIPSSVTSIGTGGFQSCTSLVSVTIGDSVVSIGGSAFRDCSNLATITIPDSVTSIKYNAFRDCTRLTGITIPDSVTEIGKYAFVNCTRLETIEIGALNVNYTAINGVLFNKEKAVLISYPADKAGANYIIPDSVTSIENYAFQNCNRLLSITLRENSLLASIGDYAFQNCTRLTDIIFGENSLVTSIGNGGFQNCTRLTDIIFGENSLLASIGNDAFYNCSKLASITIPDSVNSIGNSAFFGCTRLTSITIGESITGIGRASFAYCNNLTNITIPDSVTSIENSAFFGCTRLTGITFGENSLLASIGHSTFSNCHSLASITIPDSVTSIGRASFAYCDSLTNITIPDSVTSIENSTFFGCTRLTGITFGENSLLASIGNDAFNDCSNLASITIPDSVTSIGGRSFFDCTSLANIIFLGAAPTVGTDAFSDVADGARAYVRSGGTDVITDSFGKTGNVWQGLTVFTSTRTLETTIFTGRGSVAGDGTFSTGSRVTLTATPDDGYMFVGWLGDATGSVSPLTLTIERDMTVGAIFIDADRSESVSQASYDAVVAERDARPTQASYDTAVATARTDGRADVAGDPASYSLVTQASYDAVVAQRDDRPTQATYDALETERDAAITERDARPTQVDYNAAVATARTDGQDDVTAAPNNFDLTTQSAYEDVADLLDWSAVFAGLPDYSATNGPAQTVIPSVQNADGFAIALKFNPAAADLGLNAKRVIYEFGGTSNGNGVYLIGGIPHFIAKMNGHSNKNPDSLDDLDWSGNAICVPLADEALTAGSVVEIDLLFTLDAVRFSINGADPLTVALDNRGEFINWSGDRTLGFGKKMSLAGGLSNTKVQSEFHQDEYARLTGSFISGGWWNQSNASGLQFGSGGLAMQEIYDAALRESTNPFAEQLAVAESERDTALTELNTRPTADQLATVETERDAAITERDARPTQVDYNAAVLTAHTNGRADVTGDPASYSLVTQASYDAVVAQRDDRPTQATYDALETERDAAITERDARPTQVDYNAAVATARTNGRADVTGDPASYSLVRQASYDAVVAQRDDRPTQAAYDALETERDAAITERDARPTQVDYNAAVLTAHTNGRADVTGDPASYSLVRQASYDAVVAQRDDRPTQATYDALETERDAAITERDARPTQVDYNAAVATARTDGRADVTGDPASYSLVTQASYDAVVAQRDDRPTQAAYDALETERDAAITERDARPTQVDYNAAVATARTNGQDDVTAAPNNFDLTTQSAYEDVADLLDWSAVFAGLPDYSATNGPAQTVIPSVQNADGFAIALKFNPAAADLGLNAKRVIYEFGGTSNGNGVYLIGGIPHFIAKMNGHSNKNPDSLDDLDWSGNAICVPLADEALTAGSVVEIDLLFTLDAVRFSINGADPLTVALDNRGEFINWSGDRTLGFGKKMSLAGGLSNTKVQSEFHQDEYARLTGSFISGGWWNQSNASGLQFGSGGLAMQEIYDAALRESTNPFAEQLAVAESERDTALTELNTRPTADQLATVETERDAAITERDARPTQVDYNAAVATARTNGRADVTGDPASYSLVRQASYDAVVAQRDDRPTQATYDALETERDAAITERDARPTQVDYNAAVLTAHTNGRADVTGDPASYSLVTQASYDAVVAQRDDVVADIQLAYDDVAAAAGTTAGDLAPVGSDGTTFDLIWRSAEDPSDTITMTMEFAEGSITNRPDIAFDTTVQESALTINYQGSVTTHLEPNMIFQVEEELDFSQEFIGQAGFGLELGGDFNIFGVTVDEGTFQGLTRFTVGAPNGVKYTLTSMKMRITSFGFLELSPLSEIYLDLAEANEAVLAERDAAIAERDARPTLAEVQDARVGSIVVAKDWQSDEVSLCFGLQKTDDLVSWTAFEGGTWRDAPNGEFKLTLPLVGSKKWLRLTLPE